MSGRPTEKRTPQTLNRDIAAIRRLRRSLAQDDRLSEGSMKAAVSSLDMALGHLTSVVGPRISGPDEK
jgi:hypothetical protein